MILLAPVNRHGRIALPIGWPPQRPIAKPPNASTGPRGVSHSQVENRVRIIEPSPPATS